MTRLFLIAFFTLCANMALAQNQLVPQGNRFNLNKRTALMEYWVHPSFNEPAMLYIDSDGQLVLEDKEGTRNMKTNDITIKKLESLFKHSINVAMYPFEVEGNDGTTYVFIYLNKVASTWSPDEGNCKRLVEVMNSISKAVRNKSQKEIDKQIPAIDSLTTIFKGLYPEEFFKDSPKAVYDDDYTKISLYYRFSELSVKFEYPKDKSPAELEKEVEKKYCAIIENVHRDLSINTHALDEPIRITVNNDKEREYNKESEYGNSKCFTLHEEDITEERLKQILLGNYQNTSDSFVKMDSQTIIFLALGILVIAVLLIDILRHTFKKSLII